MVLPFVSVDVKPLNAEHDQGVVLQTMVTEFPLNDPWFESLPVLVYPSYMVTVIQAPIFAELHWFPHPPFLVHTLVSVVE